MAVPTAAVLDTVLNNFRTQIDSGYGALTGPVQSTLGAVIVISVSATAIMWAVDESTNIWGPLIRKVLLVGFWSYMITNWQTLAMAAISAFGKLGISAGGGGAGLSDFLDSPSKVFACGYTDAKALIDFALYSLGQTNSWGTMPGVPTPGLLTVGPYITFFCQQLPIILEALVCCLVVLFAFGWLSLEIVCVVIEFHIVTLIAFIVLPFGILSQTSSLAENAIAYVFRAGFKAMVLGLIIGMGTSFLTNYTLIESTGTLPDLNTFCGLALSVLIILMLAISAPKYAAAVASGAPTTGAGGLAGAAGGIIGAGVAAYNVGKFATGQAARAISGGNNGDGGGSASANSAAAGSVGGSSPPGSPSSPPGTGGSDGGSAPEGSGAARVAPGSGGQTPPSAAIRPKSSVARPGASTGGSDSDGVAQAPWYQQKGGVAGLSPEAMAQAEDNYETYLALNPTPPDGFNFERFVEVGQADRVDPVS
ncbi:MAG: type IV secretion system protein, partial [Caulobacteraceae bacterium]